MAGGPTTEESEPLFVLEPLPELSGVMDSFADANVLLLLFGFGAIVYILTKFPDPMTKLWVSSLTFLVRDAWRIEYLLPKESAPVFHTR